MRNRGVITLEQICNDTGIEAIEERLLVEKVVLRK
jgi:hypothetical protein